MSDQLQNPSPNQNAPQRSEPERKPAIRTMKSDLEELTSRTKRPPALAIARELAKKPQIFRQTINTGRQNKKRILLLTGTVLLFLALGGGAYLFLTSDRTAPVSDTPTHVTIQTPSLFATEAKETITIKTGDDVQLLRLLQESSEKEGREGTLKRVMVKINGGPEERLLGLADFFEILKIEPPSNFIEYMERQMTIFIFYGSEGGEIGFAVKTRDINRALRDLFVWEPAIISSFGFLFFDKEHDLTDSKFEDRIYRNIDWRFLKVSSQKDMGIAYTVFPANNILVLATSRMALETVINRLFDLR